MVSQRAEGGGVPSKALVVLSEVMLISCGKSGKTAGTQHGIFHPKQIERKNNIENYKPTTFSE